MIRESVFEQMSRVPEHLAVIHDRLCNWAEWSRDRIRRGHCRSIEHRYHSGDVHQEDRGPRSEWDALDAEALHSVVCALPHTQRWIVHMHYIHRLDPRIIRRKLALTMDGVAVELNRARVMVINRAR